MKYLLILFAMLITSLSCSSITEPQKTPMSTAIYTLPYDRHYDGDAQFISENPIDTITIGVIREIRFFAYNFGDSIKQYPDAEPTVFFNFFLTVNQYDTLYFSPKLSTKNDTEFIVTLNTGFNGLINVHIFRYETFKPIDFRCEIFYFEK